MDHQAGVNGGGTCRQERVANTERQSMRCGAAEAKGPKGYEGPKGMESTQGVPMTNQGPAPSPPIIDATGQNGEAGPARANGSSQASSPQRAALRSAADCRRMGKGASPCPGAPSASDRRASL